MRSPLFASLMLTAMAALAAPASAQSFGPKAGLDLTTVTDDYAENASPQPGGTVGGFITLRVFRGLSAGGEALYTIERTKIEFTVEHRMTYVELPAYLRYRVWGSMEGMHAYAIGGYVYRWLLDAEETVNTESQPIDNGVASSDSGALVGVQFVIKPRWVAEARYIYGLTDFYNQFRAPRAGRHLTWQFTVAYRLRR